MDYHRIVVKLGTNLLTGGSDRLNLEVMASLVGQVARLHVRGYEVILVSSGAIAAGRQQLSLRKESKDIPFKQVLAAVGQSRLMDAYDQLFKWHDMTIAQTLLTRNDLADRLGYINARNTLLRLLDFRVIPIVNENDVVAVDEIQETKFGDNDMLSAMVANLLDADLLLLLTDIDGLYNADPNIDKNARLIENVDKIDDTIERFAGTSYGKIGTGGMATKVASAKLATTAGVTVVIANGREPDIIIRLTEGESIGTFFKPVTSKMEGRKRWLMSCNSKGKITVDSGAVEALRVENKSLLPAGIIRIDGRFERGDIVSVFGQKKKAEVARGISNYRSHDIEVIKGSHSNNIRKLLGYEFGTEVVHRNNLVIL